ncbi:hypothetical protein LOZ53_002189 [Ophidiomyces ophidiicola]|nr:hypothetical protein LOZ55_003225 [Ophidiomyces ophidiicola]KAI1988818.1 hypothetical protein LOZ54_003055 [Ophidiomyces ophidiicola]KAI1993280.1 hypothetical protein LOZ53_002189 [Ophidiomyces ophidiicola]KAI1993659.1 hypothetical protein LOZ51_004038 [Ophidiomyces ophidiicola]
MTHHCALWFVSELPQRIFIPGIASPDFPSSLLANVRGYCQIQSYIPETNETPEGTTKAGLELIHRIKEAKDKHQNLVAPEFLHLPDRNEYPDYFQAIKLPLALDTIEQKLQNHEYPCLTLLEADLRRMVTNAKAYNTKGSSLFSNAERIRKIVSAVMIKINPAYKDENYTPFAAPLPDDDEDEEEVQSPQSSRRQSQPRNDNSDAGPRTNGRRHSHRTPTTDREIDFADSGSADFKGDSFKKAQERIISEMIRLKDEDGVEVFQPFLSKPDRGLYKEYYDIIKHPTSLWTVLRRIRGAEGRKDSTTMSPYRTWDAFAEEVSYIWRNTREFNVEGSAIVELSGELESHFKERLEEARRVVPEPAPPSIKLRVGNAKTSDANSQKLMLKFPGRSGDSASEKQKAGFTVDGESLKRQQELVRAGSGSRETPIQPNTSTRTLRERAPPLSKTQTPSQGTPMAASPPRAKIEGPPSQPPRGMAPNVNIYNRQPNGTAPAPAALNTLANGSPISITPGQTTPITTPRKILPPRQAAARLPIAANAFPPKKYVVPRSRLITHVNVHSEERLGFNIEIPSASISPRQSVTLSVPFSHNHLFIKPTVVSSSLERQTQLTVTVGNQKIHATGSPIRSADFTVPKYELRLGPGITKIDIEMYAAPGRGLANLALPNGPNVEYEAFTLFLHVMHA